MVTGICSCCRRGEHSTGHLPLGWSWEQEEDTECDEDGEHFGCPYARNALAKVERQFAFRPRSDAPRVRKRLLALDGPEDFVEAVVRWLTVIYRTFL